MLIIFFAICIAMIIIGILLINKNEDLSIALIIIGSIVLVIVIIVGIILGVDITKGKIIDNKIEMLQEENEYIQSQTATIVKEYMNWEQETYDKIAGESPLVLIQLYPELKSSELVSKQIEIYIRNNDEIKSLKNEKLNISVEKFWLYFGK